MIYLYAVVADSPARPRVRGVFGESLRALDCRGLSVVIGDVDGATGPAARRGALERHDAAVCSWARDAAAILPARFGSMFRDERELRVRLGPVAAALRRALVQVRAREQMTIRVFAGEAAPIAWPRDAGPGTRWLLRRRLPSLAPLRDALAPWVRAERIERHASPPLVASIYHLIDRGAAPAYARAVRAAARGAPGVRLRASGPFPPYAFAPTVAP